MDLSPVLKCDVVISYRLTILPIYRPQRLIELRRIELTFRDEVCDGNFQKLRNRIYLTLADAIFQTAHTIRTRRINLIGPRHGSFIETPKACNRGFLRTYFVQDRGIFFDGLICSQFLAQVINRFFPIVPVILGMIISSFDSNSLRDCCIQTIAINRQTSANLYKDNCLTVCGAPKYAIDILTQFKQIVPFGCRIIAF